MLEDEKGMKLKKSAKYEKVCLIPRKSEIYGTNPVSETGPDQSKLDQLVVKLDGP